ncbi:MAG: SDR family NAD(P)-dependent oxidoreductase, partial [Pseudomonadota bacterium]|nr:SDR family NAD(P)-dependent oxidoreductase [Pseudomonadota bacterium]
VSEMDLADLKSVSRFANDFAAAHDRLNILIANAGVMACPEQRTAQGWEWQFGVNHVGHFVLGLGLMNLMASAEGARLVTLSSIAHRISGLRFDDMHFTRDPYEKWTAYGQSKTAQALFAVGVNARLKDRGVEAFGVHPGGIFTPLQRHLHNKEMAALGWTDETGKPSERAAALFKTPAQGATTSLWCATSPKLAGKGGVYCEDCNIATLVADDDTGMAGVRGWAVDASAARKLWDATESLLSEV